MVRGLIALALYFAATSAFAESYAFIVGVGGYDEKYLKPLGEYPRNDAIELRKVLLDSGYRAENVVLMVDDLAALPKQGVAGRFLPEARKVKRELELLLSNLERDDSLIVALTGHGVQFRGEKEPYFCPLDARLDNKRTLMPLTWLYKQLEYDAATGVGCKPRQKLLLVDACRNDPASRVFKSARGASLASVTQPQLTPLPEGVVALFSCAEGQQALQHAPLKHGVFFYHLLEGFRGKADGDGDQTVTLDEVIAYSKARTKAYARVNLAASQTPRQKGFFDGTWELRKIDAPKEITNSIGMKLRLIPAGEYWMGSSDEQVKLIKPTIGVRGTDYGQPRHKVRITRDYYIGKNEITKGQFAAFVADTGYLTEAERNGEGGYGYYDPSLDIFGPEDEDNQPRTEKGERFSWRHTGFLQGDQHPVVNVTRGDALAFCDWLSRVEGQEYRLPTEAEWEYACRGGTKTIWSFGDNPKDLLRHANGPDNSAKKKLIRLRTVAGSDGFAFTAPVGSFPANAFGLHDMHGNVQEFCADMYRGDYYAQSPKLDPKGPSGENSPLFRGGSWLSHAVHTCAATREAYFGPNWKDCDLGFRVVRTK